MLQPAQPAWQNAFATQKHTPEQPCSGREACGNCAAAVRRVSCRALACADSSLCNSRSFHRHRHSLSVIAVRAQSAKGLDMSTIFDQF